MEIVIRLNLGRENTENNKIRTKKGRTEGESGRIKVQMERNKGDLLRKNKKWAEEMKIGKKKI